ncbi:MAG: hypothetical protein JO326_04860 [Acetobacteraceae bacterium]|nr:hypothetical protein [Acetobacteraceae bacterium]
MTVDLRDFVGHAEAIVASHALGTPGDYRRWNRAAPERDLGRNPYGCADAANILYTIGRFPRDPAERASWIATMQAMQDHASGLFVEATHHPIHTTAHCIAALELFDAGPSHRIAALERYADEAALAAFLGALDWAHDPWRASHQGAGLFAALVLAGQADLAWQDRYFAWLWEWADGRTGFFGPDPHPVAHSGCSSMVPHMAGSFHYFFNMQWARRPFRYPEQVIDSCLDMLAETVGGGGFPLGRTVGFAEIDWLFCVNRALRQCGHRFADAQRGIATLGRRLTEFLLALDPRDDDGLNDLHALFGTLCALAELQQAVPGLVRTARPLKLVLDRRPFI